MKTHNKSDHFKKVKKFVIDAFGQNDANTIHLLRTVDWVLHLKPNATEALLIAAVSHDIGRSSKLNKENLTPVDMPLEQFMKYHQETSAAIMENYLTQIGVPQSIIQRVKELISKHETGGDEDQNLLKDADSLSFLETKIDHFLNEQVQKMGIEVVREKFDWMFRRIDSKVAKKFALPLYDDAMKKVHERMKIASIKPD